MAQDKSQTRKGCALQNGMSQGCPVHCRTEVKNDGDLCISYVKNTIYENIYIDMYKYIYVHIYLNIYRYIYINIYIE